MHSAVQTAVITIISYKPLSGLNFARYTGQYGSYMPSSPLGVYKPLVVVYMGILEYEVKFDGELPIITIIIVWTTQTDFVHNSLMQ